MRHLLGLAAILLGPAALDAQADTVTLLPGLQVCLIGSAEPACEALLSRTRAVLLRDQPSTKLVHLQLLPSGQFVTAQRRDANDLSTAGPTTVTGFVGHPWGTPRDSITAQWGQPTQEQTSFGAAIMEYRADQVLGREVTTYYIVHADSGLISGGYLVPIGGAGESCAVTFIEFRNAIASRYPTLRPSEQKRNGSAYLGFCASLSIGQAYWSVQWRDEPGDVTIGIVLEPQAEEIRVKYEGPYFGAWSRARNAKERALRF